MCGDLHAYSGGTVQGFHLFHYSPIQPDAAAWALEWYIEYLIIFILPVLPAFVKERCQRVTKSHSRLERTLHFQIEKVPI